MPKYAFWFQLIMQVVPTMIHQTLFKVFPFFLPLWSSCGSRRGRKANPKCRKRKTWIQPKPQNIVDNAKYQIPNIPTQTLKYCRQNTARQYNHHLGELSNPNIDLGHHQLSEDSKESFTQVAPSPPPPLPPPPPPPESRPKVF